MRNTRGEKRKERERARAEEGKSQEDSRLLYIQSPVLNSVFRSFADLKKRTALVLWTEILVPELVSWRTSSILIIVTIKLVHNFLYISTRRCLVPDLLIRD